MKIRYKKKHLNHSLIFGTLWLVISLLGIFIKENPYWTDYGFLIISFLYLGTYFYGKRNKYLTIENGQIYVNKPFGKKISLTEIKQIKKFAGDYILKTDKTELTINTQIIDEKSLVEFRKIRTELKNRLLTKMYKNNYSILGLTTQLTIYIKPLWSIKENEKQT